MVFGDIIEVKYIPVKACAFIQYKERSCAEAAIKGMNGKVFGAGKIRVSWGRAEMASRRSSSSTSAAGSIGAALRSKEASQTFVPMQMPQTAPIMNSMEVVNRAYVDNVKRVSICFEKSLIK